MNIEIKNDTRDLYEKYEQGYEATIEEHKHNIAQLIREAVEYAKTDYDLYDCANALEEHSRVLNELDIEWQDNDRAEIVYSQDLNHFAVKRIEKTYKEKLDEYVEQTGMSARMYIALLKLALDLPTVSSQEATRQADEKAYKTVLQALGEIE